MNKLKILVLAFPSTASSHPHAHSYINIIVTLSQSMHKTTFYYTTHSPCASKSLAVIMHNIILFKAHGINLGFSVPFHLYIHDQQSNQERHTHTWVANMHVPPILAFWCIVSFRLALFGSYRKQTMNKLKILVLALSLFMDW